jgi:hypothetical protein
LLLREETTAGGRTGVTGDEVVHGKHHNGQSGGAIWVQQDETLFRLPAIFLRPPSAIAHKASTGLLLLLHFVVVEYATSLIIITISTAG